MVKGVHGIMDMNKWIEEQIKEVEKKATPLLSFPSVQMLYVTVKELISSSNNQALGMKMIADKYDMAAAVAFMDLSVEAEAFGSTTIYSADEVPTITGSIVTTEEEAKELRVPEVGEGRTGVNIEGVEKALKIITDRPVFAGCIGPFSLAGRLMDVNEAMVNCYEEPEMVHVLLEKVTDFIIDYCKEYKKVGAHGVIMAEPLAGILSPGLMQEFSTEYVRKIVDAVQDENFLVIYHNCGNEVARLIDSINKTGCKVYHFGDSIEMIDVMDKIPSDILVMGNISPAKQFRNGTEQSIKEATIKLMEECSVYPNFMISSGCDIPPLTDMENIDAFFEAVESFYYKQRLLDLIA